MVNGRSTRRGFLAATGAAGLSAGLGLASGATAAEAGVAGPSTQSESDSVSFYGPHQGGIATPTQQYLQFAALDMASDSLNDLRWVLRQLSSGAERLAMGKPVGATETGGQPPVDTGEAIGLSPARTTVTIGLGPGLFAPRRFGLASRRPKPLVALPSFAGDELVKQICGGDIGLQVCADDPQVAFHAVHDLLRLVASIAPARWLLAGFGRTPNSRAQATPRNLMGFKDGTNNLMIEDAAGLRQFVWAREPESPSWMNGGSYMVVRRIAMDLGTWDDTGLDQQQLTFGRQKLSGAPLGGVHEHDPVNLHARRGGKDVIPATAHIRVASASYNTGERILRRGYSYLDGLDRARHAPAAGLLFICYQRDPRKQFIPIQLRLSALDALNQFTTHVGSAIFACPPGIRPGGFVGEGLFA